MFYVYILKDKNNKLYIGYSSNLRRRLLEHKNKNIELIYYEAYKNKSDALKREKSRIINSMK